MTRPQPPAPGTFLNRPGNLSGRRLAGDFGPSEFPKRVIRFSVEESWFGVAKDAKEIEVETGMGGGDCGFGFERGEKYIVYAYKKPDGHLGTGICSRTKILASADEDLKFLRSLEQAKESTEIRVSAVDIHGEPSFRGVPGVRLRLSGPSGVQVAKTDKSGKRVFSDLPPGEYLVSAVLSGYVGADVPRPVTVRPKGCAEVMIPMRVDRRITGQLRSLDGQPAAGVTVDLVPTRPRYPNELPFPVEKRCNRGGRPLRTPHDARRRVLSRVNLVQSPRAGTAYTRWFYPGTEDAANALRVRVSEAPSSTSYDMTLPAMQQARGIEGIVLWPDGTPAEGVNLLLEDPRWPWQASIVNAVTQADGRFALSAFDGTQYRLHANQYVRAGNKMLSAEPTAIAPGSDPVRLRLVLTKNGSSGPDASSKELERWRSGNGF